jgi:hypothetical protein
VPPFFLVWWIISCAAIGPLFAHALWATETPDPLLLVVLVVFALVQLPVVQRVAPRRRAWWWLPATTVAIAQGSAILAARAIALTQTHPGPFGVLSMVLAAPAAATFAGRIQARVLPHAHLRPTWQRAVSIAGALFLLYITYAPPGALTPPPPVVGPDGRAHYVFGPPALGLIDPVTLHGLIGGLLYGAVTAVALVHLRAHEPTVSADLAPRRAPPDRLRTAA